MNSFNIDVNERKIARCSWVLVVAELVIRGTSLLTGKLHLCSADWGFHKLDKIGNQRLSY